MVTLHVQTFPLRKIHLKASGACVDHMINTSLLMTSLLTINTGVPANDVISMLVVNWRAKPKSANLIWQINTGYYNNIYKEVHTSNYTNYKYTGYYIQ